MNVNFKYSCAVFGHSEIEVSYELKVSLKDTFIDLIANKNVGIFYFGGFGEFDKLCWEIVTELKQTMFPHIKRIYVCENETYVNRPHKRPKWLKKEDYEEIIYFRYALIIGIHEFIIGTLKLLTIVILMFSIFAILKIAVFTKCINMQKSIKKIL